MEGLTVKGVDMIGDTIMAAQDRDGNIWAGVSYFCKALGMTDAQRDTQTEKVRSDKTLSKATRKFPGGVFGTTNESYALRLDFIPLWLAKITITKRMESDHPELADKLLQYQLKAKDILAAAFLPQQDASQLPTDPMKMLELHYEALKQVNNKVDTVSAEVKNVKDELEAFKQELPLFPEDADEVRTALNKRVVDYLGGIDSNAYQDRGLRQKAFIDAYRELKRNFKVSTYKSIKRNQKKQALEVIAAYRPPVVLLDEIQMVNSQISLDLEGGASRC